MIIRYPSDDVVSTSGAGRRTRINEMEIFFLFYHQFHCCYTHLKWSRGTVTNKSAVYSYQCGDGVRPVGGADS